MIGILFKGRRWAALPLHNATEERGWRPLRWSAEKREAVKFATESAAAAFAAVYIPHQVFSLADIDVVS